MFKFIFISLTSTILFTACVSNKTYNIHDNYVNFNSNKTYTSDSCTTFSYKSIINDKTYGKLFKEVITLDSSCKWNGFERGYFTDLFKNELKLNSMKNVETLDFPNYEITTYQINDNSYVNFIYFYLANDMEIIIDYNGVLSDEIVRKFDKDYKNKYINEKRFNSNFNSSLVQKNIINNYYSYEIEYSEKP